MINLEKSLEAKALPLIKGTASVLHGSSYIGYAFCKKKLYIFSPGFSI